jgi:hypothetical protein
VTDRPVHAVQLSGLLIGNRITFSRGVVPARVPCFEPAPRLLLHTIVHLILGTPLDLREEPERRHSASTPLTRERNDPRTSGETLMKPRTIIPLAVLAALGTVVIVHTLRGSTPPARAAGPGFRRASP